ncbi:hypothetical protein RJO15_22760 [Herbaspirillum huttiense F1]|uniref:AbiU2 domain-containing protein n=1 Tax=Herbaspirillum huttiense TaxID=863372 RepID=UPI002884B80D|nr:hypothetical protein [Herbaspirillum huttiense]MDT0358627.1 hypothetical protein [Herbaspirillum huttiense F1]
MSDDPIAMIIEPYRYPIDECDIPVVRHPLLQEYRKFRHACLESLNGHSPTSVMNQVYDLTWYTAVFRTLNESRRMEPERNVNGAMWGLITAGYAQMMILGIRRLVDRDPQTDSLWSVIDRLEKRPEFLTRELFICYDGLPFAPTPGHKALQEKVLTSDEPQYRRLPMAGPDAWAASELMHAAFDKWLGAPQRRRRLDRIPGGVLVKLKDRLNGPAIKTIKTIADRHVAHAERISPDSKTHLETTYNDINNALSEIVRIANYVSGHVFYDTTFGSAVATPQYDVLEALDQPWVTTANLSALNEQWHRISNEMDEWVSTPFELSGDLD